MQPSRSGQTATELAVIVGLVALVGIGALNFFSGALQTQTDKLSAGVSGTIGGMLTMPGGGGAGGAAGGAAGTGGTGGQANVTGGTGSTAISSYPVSAAGFEQMMSDMPNLIETSGASGTTKELLAYMSAVGDELLANGEITEADHNLLQDLANKGHEIANKQEAFEAFIKALPPETRIRDLYEKTLEVEGKTYTLNELKATFETYEDPAGKGSAEEYFRRSSRNAKGRQDQGPLMLEFSDTYLELMEQPALANNPSVKNIVDKLSHNMTILTDDLSTLYDDGGYEHRNDTVGERTNNFYTQYDTVGRLNHANSAGICETGGGNDSGTLCGS